MDEQVKARLIGATVLVAITVALVPELLSGPKQPATGEAGEPRRGTKTITIDLGSAVEQGSRVEPAPAAPAEPRTAQRLPTVPPPGVKADRTPDVDAQSVPAARTASPAAPVTAPARSAPAPKPAGSSSTSTASATPPRDSTPPAPEPKPAAPARGDWAVQVGAFGSAATARKMVSDLKRDGYPAYVAPLQRSGSTLHRVRVGPTSRAEADRIATQLKARGLPATVVSAG
jgi:DedD protein